MKIISQTGEVASISNVDKDLAKLSWKNQRGYLYRNIHNTKEYLHRTILERKVGRALTRNDFTDHIDRNTLNNTRSNIRLATNSQNQSNQKLRKDNKSGARGITRIVVGGKYVYFHAHIRHEGIKLSLGHYKTFEEAKKVRDEVAIKLKGKFAVID